MLRLLRFRSIHFTNTVSSINSASFNLVSCLFFINFSSSLSYLLFAEGFCQETIIMLTRSISRKQIKVTWRNGLVCLIPDGKTVGRQGRWLANHPCITIQKHMFSLALISSATV